MRALVIIPAYNEAASIQKVIEDLQTHCPQCDYVVINDCSTDETRDILRQGKASFLDLPANLGIGGGVQTGYRYALERGYDAAIQFDGDGQHDARYIGALLNPLERDEADVVIGSRFLTHEGFQSSSMRRLGIRFLGGLIYLLSGVRVRDVTSGMRAVNRHMIAQYAASYAQDYPEPEAILEAALQGARIAEVPVQMRERQAGTSSIDLFRSGYYMFKVSIALVLDRIALGRRRVQ